MPGNILAGALPHLGPPGSVPALGLATGPPGSDPGLAAIFAALLAQHTTDLPSLKTVKAAEKDKLALTDNADKKENTTPDGTAALLPLPPLPPLPEITLIGQTGPNPLPNAGKTAGKRDAMDTVSATPVLTAKKPVSELLPTTRRIKPQTALQSQPTKTDTITRVHQAVSEALNPPVSSPAQPISVPMPPHDRAQMVRQITEGIGTIRTQALPGGQGRMTLQLHPKDWGKLEVSVTLTPISLPDGSKGHTVVAHIAAENPQVKAALDANPGELRRALGNAGMALERLTVSVQGLDAVAQSSAASSGQHLSHNNNGQGGFSQNNQQQAPANAPNANSNAPSAGMSSFASFTGQPQHHRQDGQPPPMASATPTVALKSDEPQASDMMKTMPLRAAGHLDMRV